MRFHASLRCVETMRAVISARWPLTDAMLRLVSLSSAWMEPTLARTWSSCVRFSCSFACTAWMCAFCCWIFSSMWLLARPTLGPSAPIVASASASTDGPPRKRGPSSSSSRTTAEPRRRFASFFTSAARSPICSYVVAPCVPFSTAIDTVQYGTRGSHHDDEVVAADVADEVVARAVARDAVEDRAREQLDDLVALREPERVV